MNSVVYIFVPVKEGRAEVEAAIRRHLDSPEFIEVPTEAVREEVQPSEHLPLWRWFISSK